jgi:transcriptional regulator GlxA family with amidase domain
VTKVVFLLVPGLHLLDLAGPAQAFGTAADLGCGYELAYVAGQEDVPSAQGVTLRATTKWPALSTGDLIIVPGWRASPVIAGTGPLADATLKVLAAHHANGGTVASVCAGADALGRAGLLDGRRCTTHHDIQDELAQRYPRATVIRDVLYVIDDRVATSAGIASGIDLALHLIAVRDGPATAARVAREMVVYARRNGDEQQASAMLRHRSHLSDTAHRAQDHIEARFAGPLPLTEIATSCGVSQRTLTRRFTEATGLTPLRYQQLLRLERAEHLIGHGATVEAAARTVGFQDARMLRRLRAREPAVTSTSKTMLPGRNDPGNQSPVTPPATVAGRRPDLEAPPDRGTARPVLCASLLTGAGRQPRRTPVAGAPGQLAPMSRRALAAGLPLPGTDGDSSAIVRHAISAAMGGLVVGWLAVRAAPEWLICGGSGRWPTACRWLRSAARPAERLPPQGGEE